MKAGRELDKLVAEAMGHRVCDKGRAIGLSNATKPESGPRSLTWVEFDGWYVGDYYLENTDASVGLDLLPYYSTAFAAIQQVLEKLRENGWHWDLSFRGNEYSLILWRPEWVTDKLYQARPCIGAYADTIPLTVCLGALKAMGGE